MLRLIGTGSVSGIVGALGNRESQKPNAQALDTDNSMRELDLRGRVGRVADSRSECGYL